ncbi:AdoMet_MTases domain containing protein [Rhabdaerophilaceae bacterium]
MTSWIEYWNGDHPIYVNERHRQLHYRFLARDLAALLPGPDAIVLDFGCGEALAADQLAAECRKLFLADTASTVRDKLTSRFGHLARVDVLSAEEALALPAGAIDLIIIHSVAQYVPKADLAALLGQLSEKLANGGRLVVGDILPPDLSALADAKALLRFGFEGGFLFAAGRGLIRAALSDYRKLRDDLGLTRYTEAEMLAIIEGLGLTARRLEHNPGHNQARMGFAGLKVAPLD